MGSSIIDKFWRRYKRYKIEREDLEQEAALAECLGEDIEKHLLNYCEKWRRDCLSTAVRLDDRFLPSKEEDEIVEINGYLLSRIKEILTEKQFAVWYAVKIEGHSVYSIAQERGENVDTIYKILKRAQKKVMMNISEE
jgi:DNA-directed RNA polymerase specialized sigma24 family protein